MSRASSKSEGDLYNEWKLSHQAFYEVMFSDAIGRLVQHFKNCGDLPRVRYYKSPLNRV
ncbi:MAG: hypothetical protein LBL86_01515 [Coriobacteriales bacterium]|jgi:hypothetical protein|nr:hypothetical protein [Coriobacteriales bacterium]